MRKFFAAKKVIAMLTLTFAGNAGAQGIPVIDAQSLMQAIMNVMESVQQGLTQVKQYTTQLEQYEQEVLNSLAPAAYVWDQANSYVRKGQDMANTVDYYANNEGGLDRYLDRYKSASYYRNSPCFSAKGCTAQEQAEVERQQDFTAEASKHARDGQLRLLQEQKEQLRRDSSNLEQIQRGAQSARGRMEAAQAGNQIASNTANQVLALRQLLVAEQEAEAVRAQQVEDKEAQRAAADKAATAGEFVKSTGTRWKWAF